jgi:hypothetical protein
MFLGSGQEAWPPCLLGTSFSFSFSFIMYMHLNLGQKA